MLIPSLSVVPSTGAASVSSPSPSKEQQKARPICTPIFDSFKNFIDNLNLKKCFCFPATEKNLTTKTKNVAGCLWQKKLPPHPKPVTLDVKRTLPFDNKTIHKTLDNGFTYYIRNHTYPADKTAALHLVIKAGSTDEKPGEEGIAHFLEHLLFYETESYGKTEIMDLLESKGAAFGADQNAYTSFNETVYHFNIPLNDPDLLDKALHIIQEMATKAKISTSSVEGERSVILDEITPKGAMSRFSRKRNAALLEGTPYPQRYPEGLEKVVRECTPEQIRAFYQRTYQPENMALIAVGDFDPKHAEELIQKHFSKIVSSGNPPLKHDFKPANRSETQYVCHADSESISSHLQMYFPLPADKEQEATFGKKFQNAIHLAYQKLFNKRPLPIAQKNETTLEKTFQNTLNNLHQSMVNSRLKEIILNAKSPSFSSAHIRKAEVANNLFYYTIDMQVRDQEMLEAYKQILLELKRIREHGFLPSELEDAKETLRGQLRHFENESQKVTINGLVETYISHFNRGTPASNVEEILKIKRGMLELINLENIQEWNEYLTSQPCSVVGTLVPQAIENTVSPEALKKVEEEVAKESVSPYVTTSISRPLLRKVPEPGKIIETIVYDKHNITQWTLENGMRVFLRPSTKTNSTVLISETSLNGSIAIPLDKRAVGQIAPYMFAQADRAGLTALDFKKVLNGKNISQTVEFGDYSTNFVAIASKTNLETAFQILHLNHTDISYREEIFDYHQKKQLENLKYTYNHPEVIFHNTITKLCSQDDLRFKTCSPEEVKNAKFQDSVDFLDGLFKNPANFDLIITGNFELDVMQKYVEKYLASIPTQGPRIPASLDYEGYQYPEGIVVEEVKAGLQSQCKTNISFLAPAEDTFESRLLGEWVANLLEVRLRHKLVFEAGKSYGTSCSYAVTELPGLEKKNPSSMELEFSGMPEHIRELNQIVLSELKKIHEEGFTKEEIESLKAKEKESFRKSSDEDAEWLSKIGSYIDWNYDLNTLNEDFSNSLEAFDEKQANALFKKLFPLDRYVQVTLLPE